ncbi:nmra-like family protein [Bacillus sp. Leaf406]|nr:nmra-like family protein [Bacillus sp. Leaf406]
MRILVTGSTGRLGSAVLNQLKERECCVLMTSRRKPPEYSDRFDWVYSDMLSGEGLEEAARDIDVVIHTATSPMKKTKEIEVSGLTNFLSKLTHIKHFIYPSIVGIEDIPYNYYKHKHEAEEVLKHSNIPYTIVRATQFHSFVDSLFLSKPFLKGYFIPGNIKFQTVDVGEFANHLIDLTEKGPQGRTGDFAGPKVMTLREMADLKIGMSNKPSRVYNVALPGKLYKSLLEGKNTNPTQNVGSVTFEDFLRKNMTGKYE